MRHEKFNLPHLFLMASLAFSLASCGTLTKTSEKNQASAETHLQLGVRYMNLNKLDLAKENLLRAIDYDPNNAEAHNALAILYEKLQQFDNAKSEYEKAAKINPDDVGIKNNFGRFLCEHGESGDGLTMLAEAVSNPLNNRQWLALTNSGLCLMNTGSKEKAEPYFRQALELNRNYAPALAAMQKISYQKGDLWAAKGFFERYIAIAPQTSETLFYAYYTERALGNADRAQEYRTMLLEKFPISEETKKIRSAAH